MIDTNTPAPLRPFADFTNSQLFRILLIGVLILLLQIPLLMIRDVIFERAALQSNARSEVSASWGGRQVIEGPVLRVPYRVHLAEERDGRSVVRTQTRFAHFLPETLSVDGDLASETRYRGIFEVPVYLAQLEFRGAFAKPDFDGWAEAEEDILWDRAELVVSVSDARAIRNAAQLEWGEESFEFLPSTGAASTQESMSGFHVPLHGAAKLANQGIEFRFDLSLQGSQGLQLSPFAKRTRFALTSNWTDPSFQGTWLPATRSISDAGFSAEWDVPFLGRSFPQRWNDSGAVRGSINESHFGLDLATMVDEYRMAERSAKYAMLFLALTFGSLWLFEVMLGIRVHSIQYLLVGAGLCLFYLLELSLAEHIGFTFAYALASTAVIALITSYCLALLGGGKRAAGMASVLVALYGYLFVLLRDQDFALLVGSLGLFGALGTVMYLTRNIDWGRTTTESSVRTS